MSQKKSINSTNLKNHFDEYAQAKQIPKFHTQRNPVMKDIHVTRRGI